MDYVSHSQTAPAVPFLVFFRLELEWNFDDELDLTDFQILSLRHLSHVELDGTARSTDWFQAIASTGWSMETPKFSSFRGSEAGDELPLVLESKPTLRTVRGVDDVTSHKLIGTKGLFDLGGVSFPVSSQCRASGSSDGQPDWRRVGAAESGKFQRSPSTHTHSRDRRRTDPFPTIKRITIYQCKSHRKLR